MQKKTLREILKEKNISQQVVADALNINITNIRRYDDLMKRSVEDLFIISKATGINPSELIGYTLTCDEYIQENTHFVDDRLISIIESQQRTIEILASKIK